MSPLDHTRDGPAARTEADPTATHRAGAGVSGAKRCAARIPHHATLIAVAPGRYAS